MVNVFNKTGFVNAMWCGDRECEDKIKEETGATVRCIPFEQPGGTGKCFFTGKEANMIVLFSKAY